MKTDPLIRATKKAYRQSPVGKLDQLLKLERFWRRRETIARNHLARTRKLIVEFAADLAKEEIAP